MPKTVETAPTLEALDLATVKDFLGVSGIEHDQAIYALIRTARAEYEKHTGGILMTSTWDSYFDEFEGITLPAPLSSVTTVKYYDTDEAEQTLAATYYDVDTKTNPATIALAYNQTWPTIYYKMPNPITVRHVSGYTTAAAVPYDIRNGLLCWIAGAYDDRPELMDIGMGFWANVRVWPI